MRAREDFQNWHKELLAKQEMLDAEKAANDTKLSTVKNKVGFLRAILEEDKDEFLESAYYVPIKQELEELTQKDSLLKKELKTVGNLIYILERQGFSG